MTRIAVLQMTAGIDPAANAQLLVGAIGGAASGGAQMVFTPEMSGLIDRDRARATPHIVSEEASPVLAAVREAAAGAGIWVALGSLAVAREDGRWANRSLVIDPNGEIAARYDKIHMFDVDLATGESWRESNAYAAGDRVVTVDHTPLGRLGLTVCYDLRFPALFEALGQARCDAIAIPAAFTRPTGAAHWHVLQRARAIEASAFVIAAAQVGKHADGRETYGHSLVIDPWGDVLLDMGGEAAELAFAELDPARLTEVRAQLPSLANRRAIHT
ncbi:carbon-nitrogen hydrolase family protein [Novosphingobium sp.]|uniref:carbon-nitrogen hydrolase family protein n=1 Tax=Novosphingobium sp. TaxID=1874826 RepID=UPI0022BC90E8|nr:carbon-nitrogen hydrolase family protein [Novosphingobium sp.]MCZ8017595.1 carbon-nitrogen hydrolase family protein [Novosphingobium sp.]MCZ8033881.1 carbon-nitrogen hydrolase family protein [Novosphingobium sp.]MCZ8051237.1 carbon-nitrogen hydrolase family protein [Novosphingobium sp.]MCZ8059583.1 carbon-nitrogen hydrolase family protein [Novosphingobium sp.]MCZ8231421.1 carbon-nitrogen hydrolase family protein [Novosphingobium sp.]